MATFLEATFIGKTAVFMQGRAYQIEVVQHWFGSKLTVIATHGYQHKRIMDMKLVYASLQDFLLEWQVASVVTPDYTDGRGPTP